MRVTLADLVARARRRDDERGATLVIVVLSLIAMMGVMVLVVDVGGLLWRRREMVSGADAAALAAAQSCALGEALAGDPEAQADALAVDNVSGITPVGGIVEAVNCKPEGGGEGHVTVEYDATQDLWFAGIFGAQSANIEGVATAEWGDAATGWPVPFIVTLDNAGNVFCKTEGGDPIEINEDTPEGTRCVVWFDNSSSGGLFGGFGESVFGSLNLNKWNVPESENCSSQDLNDNKHYAYVGGYDGDGLPPLNEPGPTWVCGGGGNVDALFSSLMNSVDKTLVFPITDKDVVLAPSGVIDKFNVVGFVALYLEQVYDANQTGAVTQACGSVTGQAFSNTSPVFDLVTRSVPCLPYEQIIDLSVTGPNGCCRLDKDYAEVKDGSGRLTGFRWIGDPATNVSVTWNVLKSGPCGPKPSNSSGHCMVVEWREAQLGNGPLGGSNVGVPAVRLCDPDIPGSCDTLST